MRKPEGEAVRIRKSALRRGLGLALALTMLLPLTGPAVVADSRAAELELDGLKGDASELDSQRREIQAQLKSVQADKDNAMTRKELLEQQIDVIQQQVGNIDDQITMYGQLIEQKTEELAQAEAAEAEQYELFQRRGPVYGGAGRHLLLECPVLFQRFCGAGRQLHDGGGDCPIRSSGCG